MDANDGSRRRWMRLGPGGWRRVGAALVPLVAASCGCAPLAAASSPDASATHAYVIAHYRLVTALSHKTASVQAAERAAAARIARACPGVVAGMPPEPSLAPVPSPRVRGEDARLGMQKLTIGAELAASVEAAGEASNRPAYEAYAAEVDRLSWSNPAIGPAVEAASAARLEAISSAAPPFCTDARAWVKSGYRTLSATSRVFEASQLALRRSSDQLQLTLDPVLKPYEDASDRALIARSRAAENKLLAGVVASIRTVLRLKRVLGFPRSETEEPEKPVVLGRGRTAAGTRFEVTSGSGILGGLGCHRAATVAYTRPGAPEALIVGGPNNPICLSSPRYRHPAVFCEVGVETIQTAVPASVRTVRLVLADGRTIDSHVVRVPRRDGGPSGIYAQELRGRTSHAIALEELDARRDVVLTVQLPRYRCVSSRGETEDLFLAAQLAGGRTPEGEPFTIAAIGSFNGEPFLSLDTGVDPEVNEPAFGPGASKAFAWSLRIGCAPHPYAILYGILRAPGKSVTARTPGGVAALNVVPTPARVHAKGPLVYGVFTALPSELTVLGANGTIVYSEDLQAKAMEAAQFCEGYAEA